ncbi:MAG: CPBP family intramembrane metalloprotease [Chitinophagales bacterium]|nr:CPBP family intramembrane metalloprotease [Chitinophagales bacterium]
MKSIISYIRTYFQETDKQVLSIVSVLTALLIGLNYYFQLDESISNRHSFGFSFISRYFIFLIAFGLPYFIIYRSNPKSNFRQPLFRLLIFLAPAIFALKTSFSISLSIADNYTLNNYWNHVFYWPILLLIIVTILFTCWRFFDKEQPFYGTIAKDMVWKPYWMMLIIMLPLIAAASTQADFLAVYPKLKSISSLSNTELSWWHKLLFELSYGSDFISIELFFRGFLVLAFVKWAGKDAILPMACFYCTIHFGKPLGECISSYFGGLLLGIVVYNTRSIWGGLMVHLGIAWLMELGGYIGNSLLP